MEKAAKSWPAGVHVDYLFDQSTDIHDQLGSLSDSIILAIVLVMIIVVAALGLRSGLLVGVAIPTSFLMAFMVLNGMGYHAELHDHVRDAAWPSAFSSMAPIIVVEYADRKMTEGHPPQTGFRGSSPAHVLAGGQRHRHHDRRLPADAAVAGRSGQVHELSSRSRSSSCLSRSMVVALIFLPVLGGFFGKAPPRDEQHEKAIEASETGDWREIPGITGWYAHLADWLTHNPGRVMLGALGTVARRDRALRRLQQGHRIFRRYRSRSSHGADFRARQSLRQRNSAIS